MTRRTQQARRYGTRTLPPYRYMPGTTPHPTRDPEGHSFGQSPDTEVTFDPARWRTSEAYLFGIDLFNNGFYWEAHEAWEELWVACGRRGCVATVLKGLIALAAAGVKASVGNRRGIATHAGRAADAFGKIARGQTRRFLGLDLGALERSVRAVAARTTSDDDSPFDLVLRPK